MVVGQGATGKSTLLKDLIYNQSAQFTSSVAGDHISCSWRTTNQSLKNHISTSLKTLSIKKHKAKVENAEGEAQDVKDVSDIGSDTN